MDNEFLTEEALLETVLRQSHNVVVVSSDDGRTLYLQSLSGQAPIALEGSGQALWNFFDGVSSTEIVVAHWDQSVGGLRDGVVGFIRQLLTGGYLDVASDSVANPRNS